jgi:[ribosomal protein S5]-alanine N-acetyltransferase
MVELQRLNADRALDVLAFELGNRSYFAASINDRGDAFFDHFTELYSALLAEQEAGTCACYVLVGENGALLGRFNLYDLKDNTAVVGYRVGRRYTGCGLATMAVRELCQLAVTQYGLHTLRAAAAHANVASQKVLLKTGFVPVGPADPSALGGKPGTWYQRQLTLSGDGAH